MFSGLLKDKLALKYIFAEKMSLKDSKYGSKEQSLIKSDSKVSYVIIGGQSNIMQSNLAIRKIVSKISWTNNNNLSFTEILCHPRINFIEASLRV